MSLFICSDLICHIAIGHALHAQGPWSTKCVSKNCIVFQVWLPFVRGIAATQLTIHLREESFRHQPRMSDEKVFDILGQDRNQHDLRAERVE